MSAQRRPGESDPEDHKTEKAAPAPENLKTDGQPDELEPMPDFDVLSKRTNPQDQTTDRLDADELAEGWAEFEDRRPEKHAVLAFGAKTDLGSVRENNEDKYDLLEPQQPGILATKGRLYGVADGMGGHSAGQIASELALKTVIHTYYREPSADVVQSLRTAVSEANSLIFDTAQLIPERQGMGTTLTLAVVLEDQLIVANVGDSRTYLIREGQAKQVTNDHSWVAEQVRLGTMTLEEASLSPLRNVITRSIGTSPAVEPDFYYETLREGDSVVLCSDGLTGHIDPEELAERLSSETGRAIGPSVAAMRLVELANARGGRDNISVIIINIREIVPFEKCAFGD
ncbi:MAG TPA: Stp1/IreP family PP2C-type Ser/Thr phosphatase [Capsulimonadaceae bacterium]|nr:Stp1/IreP family PP2C-type Ser/Thr phosphatase [Capsulimonadaceae bacterium]